MSEFRFSVKGTGAWGSNFPNWPELRARMQGEVYAGDALKSPKPESIPANERRRAPLPVKLAVETSAQACEQADIAPSDIGCVFVSALGDTQLTDYMCRVLAGENKQLSPTKFHNSVHNAAAGYWTISAGCTEAANSLAGFEQSVSLTLMEALIQSQTEQRDLLLTFFDAPASPVLAPLLKNDAPFSVSLVISTRDNSGEQSSDIMTNSIFRAQVCQGSEEWPEPLWSEDLNRLYSISPVAKILSFFALMLGQLDRITMPLSAETYLLINKES